MTKEDKEIRFGIVAVEKGYVTTEQVLNALDTQVKEDRSTGKHRRIGMILLEQGYITLVQIDDILKGLERQPGTSETK